MVSEHTPGHLITVNKINISDTHIYDFLQDLFSLRLCLSPSLPFSNHLPSPFLPLDSCFKLSFLELNMEIDLGAIL